MERSPSSRSPLPSPPTSRSSNRTTTSENGQEPSFYCPCGECPRLPTGLFYDTPITRANFGESRAVQPDYNVLLRGWSKHNVGKLSKRIACEYNLLDREELFTKAAYLIHDPTHFDPPVSRTEGSPDRKEQEAEVLAPEQASTWGSHRLQRATRMDPTQLKLSENEMQTKNDEDKLGFWDQPWPFRSTCFMLFVAAIVQGFAQTATNGANVCWLDPLITGDNSTCRGPYFYRKEYGLINSSLFLGASIGCLFADPLNELLLGRRRILMLSATVILITSIISATAVNTWRGLFACRLILAMGVGGKAAVTPVFLAEIAPAHIRGTALINWQIFDALGICLGFTANLIASRAVGQTAWRWQLAATALPAFALLLGTIFVCWDSPRFLAKYEDSRRGKYKAKRNKWAKESGKNDDDLSPMPFFKRIQYGLRFRNGPEPSIKYRSKTFDTLVLLRGHELLAARELVSMHCQLAVQNLATKAARGESVDPNSDINFSLKTGIGWKRRVYDILFVRGPLQREFFAAATVMLGQQLCGINLLIFYSSQLFSNFHTENRDPVYLSFGIGLLNFFAGLPAYWWIESIGRRGLVLLTALPMAATMLGAASCFSIDSLTGQQVGTGIFTFLFVLLYSVGMGPVPFTLSAELFPLDHRMVGMSLAVFINFGFGALFAGIVPLINGTQSLLYMFAGLNILVLILVWAFVREPETPSGGPVLLDQMAIIYASRWIIYWRRWLKLNWMKEIKDLTYFAWKGQRKRAFFQGT